MKAYLDNCVVSGMVRGDLAAAEMAAVPSLTKAKQEGRLEIFTSRESWSEQDRTKDPTIRSMLERARPDFPLVARDHTLLGMYNIEDPVGGFSSNPIVTEYVDAELFAKLRKAGLNDADARHLMYAVHNGCDRFVTTDPDFLSRRSQLETLCPNTKIVMPSELAAELETFG
jgi:predicted nucleic acid-binding protein